MDANAKNNKRMETKEKVRNEVISARILAKTVDEATDHILSLFSVVWQSEQLICSCDNPNGFKEMEEGRETCSECKNPY